MIGRLVSFWDCLFLGAMLNFWGVVGGWFRSPTQFEKNSRKRQNGKISCPSSVEIKQKETTTQLHLPQI